jgi:integrase
MRRKPAGVKYRNLHARRGGVIYYERVVNGRRIKFSTKSTNWTEAAAFRDLYEERKALGSSAALSAKIPRFAEFAERYLEEDTGHLAPTTRRDRKHSYLRPDGLLLSFFGSQRIDDIDVPMIRGWWNLEIVATERTVKTGRGYLDALGAVLSYGADLGLVETNPVRAFRETLGRRAKTQRGRAQADPGRHIRPIEDPKEIDRLVEEAFEESEPAYLCVLLLLDGGVRLGEALGLRWGSVHWGADENDRARALLITESRPRGGESGLTKSGRPRRVALSKRLRLALSLAYRNRFEPSPEAFILDGVDPANFRKREWRRILKRAKLSDRHLKDLRDTYASQLLTAGVQLGYVSHQLGHSDVSVTARHYARWAGGDVYRDPLQLEASEVPADLLARLELSRSSSKTPAILLRPHRRPEQIPSS